MVSTSYNFKTLLDIHHGHKLFAMVARHINTWNQKLFVKQECIPVGCVPSAAVAAWGQVGLLVWWPSDQRWPSG